MVGILMNQMNKEQRLEKMNENYGGNLTVSEKQIGDINYTCMDINDTQYMLFVDIPSGGALQVYGMFVNLADSQSVVEGITLK